MDWHLVVFERIDVRSFSNLWYWIALAVLWSTLSHWVLGVPYDMITRAKRHGGQAEIDLEDMVRINCNRLLFIAGQAGLWLLAFVFFLHSALITTGFFYDNEFAQAVFLLLFPMSLIGALSLSTAQVIRQEGSQGEQLHKRLFRHRLYTQFIGMVSIFVTAFWGMYQNARLGVLG